MTSEELGVNQVRGAEILNLKNEMEQSFRSEEKGKGSEKDEIQRTLVVELDAAQYQIDMTKMAKEGSEDPYSNFNLLVRRSSKENNFKAVLATIRELMNSVEIGLPGWFSDAFLGYGNPNKTQYWQIPGQKQKLNFNDTFLDAQHVLESFPNRKVIFKEINFKKRLPPFKVVFPVQENKTNYQGLMQSTIGYQDFKKFDFELKWKTKSVHDWMENNGFKPSEFKGFKICDGKKLRNLFEGKKEKIESIVKDLKTIERFKKALKRLFNRLTSIFVESIPFHPRGPYEWQRVIKKKNLIRFTPIQIEAIRSGMLEGLTMVCGPPGTGKTDVAIQIVSNIYKNYQNERTLLVTHSNHALNDLFEKISIRDIDQRHLLRLGRGAKELETSCDFSKFGRISYLNERREKLLSQAKGLASTLKLDQGHTEHCETCEYFFRQHVLSKWEYFLEKAWNEKGSKNAVSKEFPFRIFFSDSRKPLFNENSWEDDMCFAELCWIHLKNLFEEIRECRVFELLKYAKDRGDFLLSHHAKIIAMTCTHAAVKRSKFLGLRMQYDNIILEETAQILDIETFIPLLLQNQEIENVCRLKRIVLIGDHNQLPPVVKNQAFQKYCKLDQSLFERLVRLGIPLVNLNLQGRARTSIAKLYSWKYEFLGDLSNVSKENKYLIANAGFVYDYQFIDVQNYEGKGESTPIPFFYQNLGEAEYVVHLYMYMRLIGIPAKKISIITTYNGQKHLIRDVIQRRCEKDPLYCCPSRVTTVDKYQGQQNDYILVSLVRTKNIGHIRDVRRLVVSLSRAKLGLYVFGRFSLFQNCLEMKHALNLFSKRSQKLLLVPGERAKTCNRKINDPIKNAFEIKNVEHFSVFLSELSEWQRRKSDAYRLAKKERIKIQKQNEMKKLEREKKEYYIMKKELISNISASTKILREKISEKNMSLKELEKSELDKT